MKNNIDYYSHDISSHNHWKFKTLRKKFGWAGEGRFWALQNMIGESANCLLEVTGEEKMQSIAADLDLTEDELRAFIDFLINKCKLLIIEEDKITTDRAQQTLAEVMKKRNYQTNWKRLKSNIETGNANIENKFSSIETNKSNIENEQSKVNKRKESKVEAAPRQNFEVPVAPSAPTMQQVKEFFYQQGITDEKQAQRFFNHYDGLGWRKGISPIFNWRSFANTWIANPLPGDVKPAGRRVIMTVFGGGEINWSEEQYKQYCNNPSASGYAFVRYED